MKIEVVNTSSGKARHESLYRVEVDGVPVKDCVPFSDLPAVIDELYTDREEETVEKLISISVDLKVRAQAMRDAATELDMRADSIMDMCRTFWKEGQGD